MTGIKPTDAYRHSSGGWGSLKAVASILGKERVPVKGAQVLARQNKPDGFMCVGCAWAKPAHPHAFEFCESGAKATAWDVTSKTLSADFFARHRVADLMSWHDHDLEEAGRLTEPLRWDAATDRYLPIGWDEAFERIGARLRGLAPDRVVFYTSGKASLEASYLYQLLARRYGTNNLPDSSNMCHESTSVALQEAIGVGVGTTTLDDYPHTDLMFFFGQNVGTNSPRLLHELEAARKRGVPIITFNPLREPGLVRFTNPQSPLEMLTPGGVDISTQYLQVRAGGDSAAIVGLCKRVLEADDRARRNGERRILDVDFIDAHTSGFDAFAAYLRQTSWGQIERISGLSRAALEQAADVYCQAQAVMAHYGMGLTQHRNGVQNVRLLTNLMLMRGNIGKPGAGMTPVRGHSNVQGQRTVGITEKPELAPLDRLARQYGFEPPRSKGMATVEACRGILDGRVDAVVQLGGNLVRSMPDTSRVEPAWRSLAMTVGITTKLNRSHLIHGRDAYLLPCLSRIEIDRTSSGEQAVSVEDSTACIHGSRGVVEPVGGSLLSETAIIARLAMATFDPEPRLPWREWSQDYALIRDAIAETYPDTFEHFNARLFTPGGFHRSLPARERIWKTSSGKAQFDVPSDLDALSGRAGDRLRLFTIRSDSQFNTTIYALDDRFRGISGGRDVLLINPRDLAALDLIEGQRVDLHGEWDDGVERVVRSLRVVAYDIPPGCVAGYYPECNPLLPVAHHAEKSLVPAGKSIPIRLMPSAIGEAA